jgi:hypothetical protein
MTNRWITAALAIGCALAFPLSAAACNGIDPVPAAVMDARFLVFAEVHGTREIPQFVSAYLCTVVNTKRAVTLVVEYPASGQAALDAFMASGGTAQDVANFKSSKFWSRPMQDGRTSIAMLQLYENIRDLRAKGGDIRVVAIDGDVPHEKRDSVMAAGMRTELRGTRGQVVALVGGPHATRTKGKRGNPAYESAIFRVADLNPLALTVGTTGGTAWICQADTPAACHAADWDVNTVAPVPVTPFLLKAPSPEFDGVFFVGTTTASPPAVTAAIWDHAPSK